MTNCELPCKRDAISVSASTLRTSLTLAATRSCFCNFDSLMQLSLLLFNACNAIFFHLIDSSLCMVGAAAMSAESPLESLAPFAACVVSACNLDFFCFLTVTIGSSLFESAVLFMAVTTAAGTSDVVSACDCCAASLPLSSFAAALAYSSRTSIQSACWL